MKLYELIEGRNDPHTHKAVFMLGGPGSGKTYVAQKIAGGTGLRSINVDEFYEMLRGQHGKGFDPELYKYSGNLTQKKFDLLLKGRLGLVIDGTGRKIDRLSQIKDQLEKLGYDTMAVFVNTELNTALDRNDMRVRKADSNWVRQVHSELKSKLGGLQQIFGNNMLIVDNTEDREDFTDAQKTITKFLNAPNTRPVSWPVNEAQMGQDAEDLDRDDLIGGDEAEYYKRVAMKVMRDAKPYLTEVGGPLKLAYRGYERAENYPFHRPFRADRSPKDSTQAITNVFNLAIQSQGGSADRQNSIFVSGSLTTAGIYGETYVIFPMGDFKYTWHEDIHDWFNTYDSVNKGINDETWNDVEDALGWDKPLRKAYEILRDAENDDRTKELDSEPKYKIQLLRGIDSFVEIARGLVIDKGLREALEYGRETMISCPGGYYYIPVHYFFKYVARYLEHNGIKVELRQKTP